jgi:hypothetical protein
MTGPKKDDHTAWWLAAVGLAGAIAGAAITGAFGYSGHSRDLDGKLIELSVGILRSKPTPETMPLREWAIDVIEKRARFTFTASQKAALQNVELPFKPGAFSPGFTDYTPVPGSVLVPPPPLSK